MKMLRCAAFLFTVTGLVLMISCNRFNPDAGIKPDQDNGGLKVPQGFSALVVADTLGSGRHIAVRSNGDVYLALRSLKNGKGIVALRDKDGDGRADVISYFSNTLSTGMDIDSNYLYFSNFGEVYRIHLSQGELVPEGTPEVIATGFEEQSQHEDKSFALDGHGNLYVNVGAPSNACQVTDRTAGSPGMDPCPQLERHAGIWKFKSDVLNQTQMVEGHRYASGIRNSIAIAWNHFNDKLYVVQHGRDQLYQLYPDLYTAEEGAELPAEEFLQVEDGDFFGWPYCYYDQMKKMKILAPEYGGDSKKPGRCADAKDPIMAFPGHLAPNDLLFYTGKMFPDRYQNGAFIAFHGSWNRAPEVQKGYFVAFVPFSNGLPSGEMETFADGFAGKDPVVSPADAIYRPMGLAQGPDGSIYVSDSEKGRIWRIIYTGRK
jgi:glucose/arabinose dehydrogenase